MKTNKKEKLITLNEKDSKYKILVKDNRTGDLIQVKITFTDKGFGLQAFKELEHGVELDDMVIYVNDKVLESDYVGVWKLY